MIGQDRRINTLHAVRFTAASVATYVVAMILFLSLTQGAIQAAGMREAIPKVVIELSSLALFCMALWVRRQRKLPFIGAIYLAPLVVCLFSGVLSGALQGAKLLEFVLFVRTVLSPVVIFLAVLNLELPRQARRMIILMLVFIFLVQLPVALWKLAFIGVDEKHWIGTLSQNAGQLGLLVPLFALSFLVPIYLRRGGFLYPVLIFFFSAFGVINEKRAIVFILPLFFVIAGAIYVGFKLRLNNQAILGKAGWVDIKGLTGRFTALAGISVGIAIAATYMIPSLRCDNEHNPQSCIMQSLTYARDYLTRGYSSPLNASRTSVDENTNIQLGRIRLIQATVEHKLDQGPLIVLFGYGAGAINTSPLLGEDRRDILYTKFGLRGTYPGAIAILFEAGLIGLVGMVLFFVVVMRGAVRGVRLTVTCEKGAAYGAGVILMVLVMGFDFFIYSIVGWTSQTLAPVFFAVLGFFLNDHAEDIRSSNA